MPEDSYQNVETYSQMIRDAANGDKKSELFLRKRMKHMADDISLKYLIRVSAEILDCRKEELKTESGNN